MSKSLNQTLFSTLCHSLLFFLSKHPGQTVVKTSLLSLSTAAVKIKKKCSDSEQHIILQFWRSEGQGVRGLAFLLGIGGEDLFACPLQALEAAHMDLLHVRTPVLHGPHLGSPS